MRKCVNVNVHLEGTVAADADSTSKPTTKAPTVRANAPKKENPANESGVCTSHTLLTHATQHSSTQHSVLTPLCCQHRMPGVRCGIDCTGLSKALLQEHAVPTTYQRLCARRITGAKTNLPRQVQNLQAVVGSCPFGAAAGDEPILHVCKLPPSQKQVFA